MFGSLSGDKLGIWVAHGEGKFSFPYELDKYNVIAQYSYDAYPANPNGSPCAVAGIASADGRSFGDDASASNALFSRGNGAIILAIANDDGIFRRAIRSLL